MRLGWELLWGPLGTFSPHCLEGLTPEACVSEGILFSSVVICRPDMELRVAYVPESILLEQSLLSTIIVSPSLFTWVGPSGHFPLAVS